MSSIYANAKVGLNHVPAYQTSGVPYAKGGINADAVTKVEFPYVTRWVVVSNPTTGSLRVGFSSAGVDPAGGGTNYLIVPAGTSSPRLEVKVSQVWLVGTAEASVMAGLTSIDPARVSTTDGASWKGTDGVG